MRFATRAAAAPALADPLGPQGRRRVLYSTGVALLLIGGLVAYSLYRFADRGQLDWERWGPIFEGSTLRFLLRGLLTTLTVAGVAMALAMVVGALAALGRLARSAPIRWLAGLYVELFRAVPLLLLIFFAYRVLPDLGISLSLFWYLVIGLVAYNGAVLGEIFRAGILSLERGQSEAAYSVGLGYWQTMLSVIIPQALRRMIPAVVSQLITLLKDTSLGYIITFEELLRRGQIVGEFVRSPLQALMVVAAMYITVNFALSQVARRLEVRQRRRYKAGGITVTGGPEDLVAVDVEGESRVR